MEAVIVGAGEVGQHVARTLSAEGHDVTLVDADPERAAAAAEHLDALVLTGNGASPRVLSDAGAAKAELLLAVTHADEVNVIAALAGRRLGVGRTVARVRDPEYFGIDERYSREVLGIDHVIHPELATAEDLADAIRLPGAVHVEYFADGQIALAESVVTDRSPLVAAPIGQLSLRRPHAIVGFVRDGVTRIARRGDRLRRGDHVLTVVSREHVADIVSYLAGTARQVHDTVILGAGRIGFPLAEQLQRDRMHVTVMESDAARARSVAERLPGAVVLHEEGAGREVLLSHGVSSAGAFVACAGDDRTNLLAAKHAKDLGADLCLAVVSREEFVPLVSGLGIDSGFSTRLTTAEAILRVVRGTGVRAMHLLLGGGEVLEVDVAEGSAVVGRTPVTAGLPPECSVAAIARDDRVLLPAEDERMQAGDRVILLALEKVAKQARLAFEA